MGYFVGDLVLFFRSGKWTHGVVDEITTEAIYIRSEHIPYRWTIQEHEANKIELWARNN